MQFGCAVLGAAKLPSYQLAKAQRMPVVADPWQDAYSLWLASPTSEHPRRAYADAWKDFHAFVKKPPADVTRLVVGYRLMPTCEVRTQASY